MKRLTSTLLFLRSPTREKYFRWLEAEFPRYLEAYRRAYARSAYLSGPYRTRLRALLARLRTKHAYEREGSGRGATAAFGAPPAQFRLWEIPASS